MGKKITKEKKEELQDKYNFPDTQYSPHIFTMIFNVLDQLDERLKELEKEK